MTLRQMASISAGSDVDRATACPAMRMRLTRTLGAKRYSTMALSAPQAALTDVTRPISASFMVKRSMIAISARTSFRASTASPRSAQCPVTVSAPPESALMNCSPTIMGPTKATLVSLRCAGSALAGRWSCNALVAACMAISSSLLNEATVPMGWPMSTSCLITASRRMSASEYSR